MTIVNVLNVSRFLARTHIASKPEAVRACALIADSIHEHGSLAGIEVMHTGLHSHNRNSREAQLTPSNRPRKSMFDFPGQGRILNKDDLKEFRRWHREATQKAIQAGFDIVVVYAGHSLTLLSDFLDPRLNRRSDEYGGSLRNRARLIGEVLEGHCQVVCV